MSNAPLNVNDSSVAASPTNSANASSADPAALPGLDLLESEHAPVLNETNDVPTELSTQGDVKNDSTIPLQSEAQNIITPGTTDTVMEEASAPVSNNQEQSVIDLKEQISDKSEDKSLAAHQQQNDGIIMEDVQVAEEPAHAIIEQPVSVASINQNKQQPELQQSALNSGEDAVAPILPQPTDELVQSVEPTKAVIGEKNEEHLQPATILTVPTEILPEEAAVTDSKKTDEDVVVEQDQQQPAMQSEAVSEISGLDSIDRALNNEPIHYSSDEEVIARKLEIDNANRDDSDSESSDSSSSSSDSDSDSDQEENPRKRGNNEFDDEDLSDDNDDTSEGPVKSAHEILDEPAPKLPDNLKITPQTQLEHVGEIFRVTGKTVVIKASVSGEFRVLDEHSVFCTSDRVPFGVLYETFGRVQAPFYSVKFESEDTAAAFKPRCGEKVFYVVSASKFLFTDKIKSVKGSDASNFHDEEVPEEEQEFSDDEKERVASSMKKNKKKKKKTKHDDADRVKNVESTGDPPASATGNSNPGSTNNNNNNNNNNRMARNNRGKPARGRGGFQSHPYQPHASNNGNNNNNFNHPINYQNSYNSQPYNNHNGGSNFGSQMNQQYSMGYNPVVGMPYYNPQNQMFNQQQQQQQQYNPQQPYFNTQHQAQQQQQQHQQQFYNPLQQHQFQMMQQIMMNFNNNAAGNQVPPSPMAQQQQGSSHFPQQQQQQPQGPPGRQAPPRSYDTDLNYGGGSK